MKNLWISHEAIEKYGKEYFNNWEADDFWNVDECYTNIKDL